MRSAVVLFPGSNRDHDMVKALHSVTGVQPTAFVSFGFSCALKVWRA